MLIFHVGLSYFSLFASHHQDIAEFLIMVDALCAEIAAVHKFLTEASKCMGSMSDKVRAGQFKSLQDKIQSMSLTAEDGTRIIALIAGGPWCKSDMEASTNVVSTSLTSTVAGNKTNKRSSQKVVVFSPYLRHEDLDLPRSPAFPCDQDWCMLKIHLPSHCSPNLVNCSLQRNM